MNDQNKDSDTTGHDTMLDPAKVGQDLESLYRMVVDKASDAIGYYQGRKGPKRFWAQFIRFVAVILFTIAGLVPLVDATGLFNSRPLVIPENPTPGQLKQIVEQNLSTVIDSGQIALLFAAVAAALIGMDKFFGLSSSWTRFISAELSLQRSLDRFRMDWALANASLKDGDEERDRPLERLQLLKDFSM